MIDTSVVYLDFNVIPTNNCKVLQLVDSSNWASTLSERAYIDITTPGMNKCITTIFQKQKVNIYNSNNLELSDVTDYSFLAPIPDGIYTITLKQCDFSTFNVTKYHFQDCQLRCQINKKLIGIDLLCKPCREPLMNDIRIIRDFLDGAVAQAQLCNVNKAMEYYNRASTLLKRLGQGHDDYNGNCNGCNNQNNQFIL